jgi:transcriptional regulator with XRE-family HTH domain
LPAPKVKSDAGDMGGRLRALRRRVGLLPREMAQSLGMSTENYRHLESGRNRLLAMHVPLIAEALSLSPETVLDLVVLDRLPWKSEDPDAVGRHLSRITGVTFSAVFAYLVSRWGELQENDRLFLQESVLLILGRIDERVRKSKERARSDAVDPLDLDTNIAAGASPEYIDAWHRHADLLEDLLGDSKSGLLDDPEVFADRLRSIEEVYGVLRDLTPNPPLES